LRSSRQPAATLAHLDPHPGDARPGEAGATMALVRVLEAVEGFGILEDLLRLLLVE
jgi:hypothetical protein